VWQEWGLYSPGLLVGGIGEFSKGETDLEGGLGTVGREVVCIRNGDFFARVCWDAGLW
jgi:hypothetical protein